MKKLIILSLALLSLFCLSEAQENFLNYENFGINSKLTSLDDLTQVPGFSNGRVQKSNFLKQSNNLRFSQVRSRAENTPKHVSGYDVINLNNDSDTDDLKSFERILNY